MKARRPGRAARQALEVKPQAYDDDPRTLAVLAQIAANLGRKEQAISRGHYTVDLMPISKDAYDGRLVLQTLAQVLCLDGTKRARDGIAGKICGFSQLFRLISTVLNLYPAIEGD